MGRRTMLWVLAGIGAVLLVLPAAASAKGVTKVVYAGPPPFTRAIAKAILPKSFAPTYNPDAPQFFNERTTINVGGTVSFLINGFHSVDFPGSAKTDLPLIIPSGGLISGQNDFAGNPFWFNGKALTLGFNPALFGPSGGHVYSGTKRVESGVAPKKPFNVTFTKPGVYKFFCDVHPGMVGYVVVKPKGKPVPTAAQDQARLVKTVTKDIKAAKKLPKTKIPADTVDLGLAGLGGVELYAMVPSTLTVNAGTVVTFQIPKGVREVHTATFGPQSYLTPLQKAFQAGPTFPGAATYPSDATMPIDLTPTSHGNGFASTGALDQDPTTPLPSSGQIDFTTPGTYTYQCLIHPFMHGTIIVK